jgi:integrase
MANRVLACLRKVYSFGVRWDLVEASPCFGIERPAAERQRDRVLSPGELQAVWQALDGEDAHTAALVKLYLLTGQRGGELRTMRWEDVDLGHGWWTIPAGRSKNKLAHRIPLSAPAVDILRGLQDRRVDENPWVFPSPSAAGHRETVTKLARRIRNRSGVSFWPHDLRRTVATTLTGELGVSRLVVAKLLNHVEPGVTRVYDRASYDREKRTALEAWAVRLDEIVRGEPGRAKVIALRA